MKLIKSRAGKIGPNEIKKLETTVITGMLKALENSDALAQILCQLNECRGINNSSFKSFTHSRLISALH
ncbi:hypothetical protein [Rheinheimera oceanensis]|uniref:hypothetical protein n=1 Tax=Rheinheimera oceanensis TaxID=2817449 RepID=UPI001BFEC91D|nr:hypothetical protein [Rheinheimera oceanensis]